MAEPVTPTPPPSPARKWFSRALDAAMWIAIVVVLGLAFLPKKSGPLVGTPAASLKLTQVKDGEPWSLPQKLERPLLIEAFASWCGACKNSSGLLSDLKEAQKRGTLDVVAVSVDDRISQARAAQKSWPIPVEVLHDGSGKFSRDYRVDVLPTYILIGTDGNVKRVTAGSAGASDIRAWLHSGND